MEMPFFGKDQPGEMCYYTPKTINQFGIMDCNPIWDHGLQSSKNKFFMLMAMVNSMVARVVTMLHHS
jgi:hypothetical protein